VTNIWNDLLQELVLAKTVKSFEILLDKYWENQEVKYDYNEEINVLSSQAIFFFHEKQIRFLF
jgi:superfamily I DNA and RNA helicase